MHKNCCLINLNQIRFVKRYAVKEYFSAVKSTAREKLRHDMILNGPKELKSGLMFEF